MIAAVILAAGESRRMETPKALLTIDSETFAECIARKVRECGLDLVYMVVGAHHEQIRKEVRGKHGLEFILNFRYPEGQLSSLKEGLRSLPTGATEALVWPVDHPLVKRETVEILISTFQKERKRITIPVHQGRRGHPVIYDIHAIQTLLSLKSSQTAKDLQAIFSAEISLADVEDPAILIDIDTPDDYQKYIKDSAL